MTTFQTEHVQDTFGDDLNFNATVQLALNNTESQIQDGWCCKTIAEDRLAEGTYKATNILKKGAESVKKNVWRVASFYENATEEGEHVSLRGVQPWGPPQERCRGCEEGCMTGSGIV